MFKDDLTRDVYSGKIRKLVSPPVKPYSPGHGMIGAFFMPIPGSVYFLQKAGVKSTSRVNISSLPNNMARASIHFAGSLIEA